MEATDGREGLRQYQQAPTDGVITDILMPVQEGFETIRLLRQFDPAIRIIAISGGLSTSLDVLEVAKLLGAQQGLAKPIQPQVLLDAVRSLLAQ